MAYLSSLNWPGNVRQLENTCQWLAVMTSGQTVHLSDLPAELLTNDQVDDAGHGGNWKQILSSAVQQQLLSGEKDIASGIISDVEKILIEAALNTTKGKKNDAAKLLGWGRNTLTRKIKELEL
jgi:two-component system nitrogen regulation response regulator GlnG